MQASQAQQAAPKAGPLKRPTIRRPNPKQVRQAAAVREGGGVDATQHSAAPSEGPLVSQHAHGLQPQHDAFGEAPAAKRPRGDDGAAAYDNQGAA
jgi:hypothetical protein